MCERQGPVLAENVKKGRNEKNILHLGIFCLLALCCGIFFGNEGQEKMAGYFFPLTGYAAEQETSLQKECLSFLMPLLSDRVRNQILCVSLPTSDRAGKPEENPRLEDLQVLMEQEQREERKLRQNTGEENSAIEGTNTERENVLDPERAERELTRFTSFTPHEKARELSEEEMGDYDSLVKNFYIIDPSTMAGSNQLNAKTFLSKDLTIDRGADDPETAGPQILIYHTHSQEGFSDSVAGDPETSIVAVGEELARILEQDYGYRVLHHTGEYDKKTRDDAYSRALPEIEEILRENPSIQVVIDLHRDEVPAGTRLVQEIDGKPTARFMFFNGLSRTKKTGNLDYLYNVYQEENLAFSFQLQLKSMEYYPGLTRKIYLKGYRYNMHVCPRSLLVELGAQNNTLEEAMNACGPLAHLLDLVLSGDPEGQ